MKKLTLLLAAAAGISLFAWGGTAQADHRAPCNRHGGYPPYGAYTPYAPRYYAPRHYGGPYRGMFNRNYSAPYYGGYPQPAPYYRGPSSSFGIYTPGFGLYIQ